MEMCACGAEGTVVSNSANAVCMKTASLLAEQDHFVEGPHGPQLNLSILAKSFQVKTTIKNTQQ